MFRRFCLIARLERLKLECDHSRRRSHAGRLAQAPLHQLFV